MRGRRPVGGWQECANPDCSKKFRPVRADAEYCSNACKQSHYRVRAKAKAAAEALFRVKQNTLDFDAHQRTAIDLRGKVKGIEVIATNTGVLVAETVPGARALAASLLPYWRETACQPEDVPALLRRSDPGPYRYSEAKRAEREERSDRDFRYRAAERGFFFATRAPVHSIAHFAYEPPPPFKGRAGVAVLVDWDRQLREQRFSEPDPIVPVHPEGIYVHPESVQVDSFAEDEFDPRDGDLQPAGDDKTISDWLDTEWNDRVTGNSDLTE
jgi:hypothetical protein